VGPRGYSTEEHRRHFPAGRSAGIPGNAREKEHAMIRHIRPLAALATLFITMLFVIAAFGQSAMDRKAPGKVIVSIYHVAPGQQLEFLKWMAARDASAKEAGIAETQWYAHTDGDSWDFIGISPQTTDAQDDKVDAIDKSKGMTTGFKSALEFRTMINSHTDTYALGPTSAAALVEEASK
jgi:hypothetical protein